jgi:hypothetical protein
MNATYPGGCGVAPIRSVGDVTALRATDWLCLGAAPTFAIMALLTCVFGGQTDILCSAAAPTSPLTGMIPMYLLMSAFHSSPWLKLMSSRRNFTDRIEPPHSNRRSHQCSQDAGSAGLHPSGRCCPALFGSSDLRVRRLVRFSGGNPVILFPFGPASAAGRGGQRWPERGMTRHRPSAERAFQSTDRLRDSAARGGCVGERIQHDEIVVPREPRGTI